MSAQAKDRRLNRRVAITVVMLSVFMALCNIKDGNIVQAMQQAQSDAVDRWGQYQATRTKQHIVETARAQIAVTAPAAKATLEDFDRQIGKYRAEAPKLAQQARASSDRYDALNVHDDQFDASEAMVSTAVSLAAVAALAETSLPLLIGWVFGAMGVAMGIFGFTAITFDPSALSGFLG
ncbi:DUF4337 domain-containing protein [Sphingobium amiense]|uniref:DUF4337 domain-containing protein n=1 Tax=Sphingobium amiense TaxID=135719 RepID=UPI001F2E42E3|nr:DUF4337 domain-containing protein [Sphingobium amiense]